MRRGWEISLSPEGTCFRGRPFGTAMERLEQVADFLRGGARFQVNQSGVAALRA
jgi:hypothetical protein